MTPPGRGDGTAYDRYLAGMDTSMRQKVALTAAHLLAVGTIADMGMGSGTGSHALAALYPALQVVGVDLDPEMVRRARARWDLPNLAFRVGDIADPVFGPGSLDGIVDSSVLHHVTTFGGYRHEAAAEALEVQVGQLGEHGVLVVRDFVAPSDRERPVWLDLPAGDGDDGSEPGTCSSAALMRRFAREFRSLHAEPGFACREVEGAPPGWQRFVLSHRHAVEFVLRKDYRDGWVAEVAEEYTYLDQAGFEDVFARLGLRLLASTPLYNPWIVRHRYEGRFVLRDAGSGAWVEPPPTNFVIVGERVAPGLGVRLRQGPGHALLGFLELSHHADVDSGAVRDLVRRPNPTLDVVPWFRSDDEVFVIARRSWPRPVLASDLDEDPRIDGATPPGWVTEPLVAVQGDAPIGASVEAVLAEAAGIDGADVLGLDLAHVSYPSPGGIEEQVQTVLVEVRPWPTGGAVAASPFTTSGRIGAIEARQVLRAAQVGGLPDARLEAAVHTLFQQLDLAAGPWIGEEIDLPSQEGPVEETPASALARRPHRRRFRRTETGAGFLAVRCAVFEELDREGLVRARVPLEWVDPVPLSRSTVVAAVVRRTAGAVWLGVDDDDLPAAQAFTGNSELVVAPAWRVPRHVRSRTPLRRFLIERLAVEHGVQAGRIWELGGPWHPSPGLTPERVYPVAVEAVAIGEGVRGLHWVRLEALLGSPGLLRDGHLRVVAFRLAQALGLGS